MDIVIKSYNAHALNTGNYRTVIPAGSPLFGGASPTEVSRANTWGVRSAKQYRGNVMLLDITVVAGTIAAGIDQLAEWINEEDQSAYQLIIQDADDSNREWYVDAAPLGLVTFEGNKITAALQVVEPIWKVVTLSTNSWSITASDQTRNIAVIGNRNARPKFTVTPTSARTGSYGYIRYVTIANRTTRIYKTAFNIPDANWDTAALVTGAKMQADGDDLRVINDESGIEEYRWFGGGGINTTTTRVFCNINLPPKIEMTVSGAISNVGAVATITIKNTVANKTALVNLKKVSYKFVAIDMGAGGFEIFKFTDVNVNGFQITGCTRAQKFTTNQSHSDGATLRHIHGYYIMYGNSTVAAPTTDDAFKPIISLANSTNTSHDYTDFYDVLYPARSCMWKPSIVKNVGGESEIYTATQDTFADTASVMGAAIKVFIVGNIVRSPTADMIWSLYHPAGITTLTWTGSKYRYAALYPAIARMEKSNNGTTWANVATEVKPTAVQTWEALSSHSSVSLSGTYLNVRTRFAGSIAASASNLAAMEVTAVTAVLDSANTPLVNFGSENNNNYTEFRVTNNNTAQWLEVSGYVPLNTSVIIDTDALTVTASDGRMLSVRLDDESRAEWLPLLPNVTNVLKYTETGAVAITFVTDWRDRNL